MKILVLNGSPHKNGTIANILKGITEGISNSYDIEWVNVYDLTVKPCTACMKCRPDNECILPEDDGHNIGRKIKEADALIIGTPTHWGNMSSMLKIIFDRNVTIFIGEKSNGMPFPRQKGKSAVIITACTAPWPFNYIAAESRGAIKAVNKVLHSGGYKLLGKIVKPGTNANPQLSQKLFAKANTIGSKF